MKKEETPARECARGDGHTPPHSLSWGKQPSLSAAYHREGYIAMFLQALYVLSLLSHVWRCSPDFPGFGDDPEGLSFQCCESVLQKGKKKSSSLVTPSAIYFKTCSPPGSFPQSKLFLIFKLRPCALAYQTYRVI